MEKIKQFYQKHGFWGIIVGIVGIMGVVLTIVYGSVPENQRPIWVTSILALTVIIILLIHIMYLRTQLAEKESSLKNNIGTTPEKIESKFKRFEKIKNEMKKIEYGYIQYSPFFWIKDNKCPDGIGFEILKQVFEDFGNNFLEQYNYKGRKDGNNWKNVFTDLCSKKFDIVLTPLFETRSRIFSFNIAYCAPIFFSNVGVYVREHVSITPNRENFDDAIKFVKEKISTSSWKPGYIPGELSEIMLKKHGFEHSIEEDDEEYKIPATDNDFYKVLKNISDDNDTDFTFMEIFKANSIVNRFKEIMVKNILKDNELLYPVSFVVRKEDTVLKNIINLRLMEMRDTKAKDSLRLKNLPEYKDLLVDDNLSELECIIKLQALKCGIKDEEFKNIFIQKYDFTKLD